MTSFQIHCGPSTLASTTASQIILNLSQIAFPASQNILEWRQASLLHRSHQIFNSKISMRYFFTFKARWHHMQHYTVLLKHYLTMAYCIQWRKTIRSWRMLSSQAQEESLSWELKTNKKEQRIFLLCARCILSHLTLILTRNLQASSQSWKDSIPKVDCESLTPFPKH